MRGVVTVLLLLSGLAGCLGADDAPTAEAPAPEPELDPTPPVPVDDRDAEAGPGAVRCDPCDVRVSQNGFLFEPHVLADPDDPDRIVAFTGDGGGPTFYATQDGGRTWVRSVLATGADADGPPASTWFGWGDPALAYRDSTLVAAALGNAYAGAQQGAVMMRDVWVATSDDHAATFSDPVVVTSTETPQAFTPLPATGPFATPDREFLAVSPAGEAVLTWVLIHSDGTDIGYDLQMSRSSDLETWSEPEDVHLGDSPKGPWPVFVDGSPWVVFATYGDERLKVARHDGAWSATDLGPGAGAPAVAQDGGRLAVATTVVEDGGTVPALYLHDGAWTGPLVVGVPEHAARRVSVAFAGDEVWVGWYDVDPEGQDSRYVVGRVRDGALGGQVLVADGLQGDVGRYGDYVFGLNGRDDGADVTYVVGDADGRWLHHARFLL